MALTRDEVFLCRLAKIAKEKGNQFCHIDSYEVGRAIGQNNKSVDNIVRMLAQTNFVKKGEETMIYITSQGLELVALLMDK